MRHVRRNWRKVANPERLHSSERFKVDLPTTSMTPPEKLDAHRKALTLNLDRTTFGSFAEIGAGQEVARWFLIVGAASGTVAKSISAYDKEVSDDLYGSGSRYVSMQRLEAMVETEWAQLLTQLKEARGATTRFFSFVDTVSARNYSGTNESHGWVGLRFQSEPGGPPSDVLLHINLRDSSNILQQEAVGILGVNLIYAAFNQLHSKESFFAGVSENLGIDRIEIDFVTVQGQAFHGWDPHELLVYLVHAGLAEAVFLSSSGKDVPPTEVLHKQAVVLAPGYFGHVDTEHRQIHMKLLAAGVEELRRESSVAGAAPLGVFSLSAAANESESPVPEAEDLLRRIEALLAQGGNVLLFRQRELYTMTALVNRYTTAPVRHVIGLSLLIRAFNDPYFHLEGRRLEGLSRLFAQNVRIYAYPMPSSDLQDAIQGLSAAGIKWNETNGWVTADQLQIPLPVGHLYAYLLASNFLIPLKIPAAELDKNVLANSERIA